MIGGHICGALIPYFTGYMFKKPSFWVSMLAFGDRVDFKAIGSHRINVYSLRIIGPSYGGVWLSIAGFWDLQTTSFEIPWFLGLFFFSGDFLRSTRVNHRYDMLWKTFILAKHRMRSFSVLLPTFSWLCMIPVGESGSRWSYTIGCPWKLVIG